MSERQLGEVIKFDRVKGFGFLEISYDRNRSVFFHAKSLQDRTVIPVVGDLFSCIVRPSDRKPGAIRPL